MMHSKAGVTVVEALVSLLLGLAIVQATLAVGARVRVVHEELLGRAEVLSSARLTGALLRAETRDALRGRDWGVHADSLWLRAFRGTALLCPGASGRETLMGSYAGYRSPDPTKDSVLVVYADGARVVRGLRAVGSGVDECLGQALERGIELALAEPVPRGAVLARVFERGAYSVADGAFRYRRGAAGRQPLTPEVWGRSSGWVDGEPGLVVHLVAASEDTAAAHARWRVTVTRSARR